MISRLTRMTSTLRYLQSTTKVIVAEKQITTLKQFETFLDQQHQNLQARINAVEELPLNAKQYLNELIETEQAHREQYQIGLKQELYNTVELNFATEEEGKTLILESKSRHKLNPLGQIFAFVGVANLLAELQGYASYSGLGVSALLMGGGGFVAYSHYLVRTSPRINTIRLTREGKLSILFETRSNGFNSKTHMEEIVIDKKEFQYNVSFKDLLSCFLHRHTHVIWCNVSGRLFWISRQKNNLRCNSHLLHHLL